jgi:predicted lipid carrier protein YhbT
MQGGYAAPAAPDATYAGPVPEFLSDAWFDAYSADVAASGSVRSLGPLVIEQRIHHVPGRGEVRYQLHVDDRGARLERNELVDPDVRITTDYAVAVAIARGEQSAQNALARGRLRLGGDIEALVRRADALAALDDVAAGLRVKTTYPDDVPTVG